MDAGWTQYVLERFKIPHQTIHNEDLAAGGLGGTLDAIVLASQRGQFDPARNPERRTGLSRPGRPGRSPRVATARVYRRHRRAGAGRAGRFCPAGRHAHCVRRSVSELPVQFFTAARSALLSTARTNTGDYYSPGSLIRIQVDTTHPLAAGMPKEAYAFTTGGQAWDVTLLREFNLGDRENQARWPAMPTRACLPVGMV